jgi:multiple sugar transport system permease protein
MLDRTNVVGRRWFKRHRERLRLVAALAVLAAVLFPVYWMVITALKGTQQQIFSEPPSFYPPHPNWEELWKVLVAYGRPLVNSIVICAMATLITLIICVPGAYALAKLGVSRRVTNILLVLLLVVQALPTIMLVGPLYETAAKLHLLNQYWTIALLDSMYAVPFGLLILRAYMMSVPDELRQAALVDGANERQAFWKVMLPNSKPGLATIIIFAFLFAWGDFVFGVTFTNGPAVEPATVSLYGLIGQFENQWQELMALATVLAVPAVMVVLGAQRALQQGIAGFGLEK